MSIRKKLSKATLITSQYFLQQPLVNFPISISLKKEQEILLFQNTYNAKDDNSMKKKSTKLLYRNL